jgi:hypothetical protein
MPNLQFTLDLKECTISMDNGDFIRDITMLMTADQDVQFKVKTLIIYSFKGDYHHILEWLLLKSPNLITLQITKNYNYHSCLKIQRELKFKKLEF